MTSRADGVRERDVGADVEAEPQVGPLRRRRAARVDDDELRAAMHRLQHVVEEDRMRLARVRAPEHDQVRTLAQLLVGAGPATCTEHRRQTDDARSVSGAVAAVDVVRAEGETRELLCCEVQLVRGLGAAEEAGHRALGRRAVRKPAAARSSASSQVAVLSSPFVTNERLGQPGVARRHDPNIDAAAGGGRSGAPETSSAARTATGRREGPPGTSIRSGFAFAMLPRPSRRAQPRSTLGAVFLRFLDGGCHRTAAGRDAGRRRTWRFEAGVRVSANGLGSCRRSGSHIAGEPDRRAPAQHVLVGARPLVLARIELLRAQVGTARDDRLEERRVVRPRARALRSRASRRGAGGGCASACRAPTGQATESRPVAPGSGRGLRSRFAHAELLERVERDAAVGRQLAARDAQHPGASRACRRSRGARSPSRLGRRAARAARRTTRAPRRARRRRRPPRASTVRDVVVGDARVLGLALVQRVGRPEQQLSLPGNREADAHLVVRDRHRRAPALAAVDDQVHALADSRIDGAAEGSSRRRTRSSHGPVALTIERRARARSSPSTVDLGAPSPWIETTSA